MIINVALTLALIASVVIARRIIKRWDPPGDPTTDVGVRKGLTLAAYVIAAWMLMAVWGVPVSALSAILGGLAAGLAFSARDFISNILGAVTLFLDRPFSIGDEVSIIGYQGKVEMIGMRATVLRIVSGTSVTIPNKLFASEPLHNMNKAK